MQQILIEPFTIGLIEGIVLLQLTIGNDLLLTGIHCQHAARFQSCLADNMAARDLQSTDF